MIRSVTGLPEAIDATESTRAVRRFDAMLVIEYLLAATIIGALAYSFWFMLTYGYFPQPFFYDIGDTWMDWFNPAY